MLTRNRWAAMAAAGVLTASALVGATGAAAQATGTTADGRCRAGSTGSSCLVEATVPGKGQNAQPVLGRDGKAPKRANFCEINEPLPGDSVPYRCDVNYDPVNDCVWVNMSPQPTPPAGKDPERGAWEQCNPSDGLTLGQPVKTRWMDSTQAGPGEIRQAAQTVVKEMQLKGIEIGMVPYPVAENGTGAVGLPAWMWVGNPDDPQAWGPYTVSKDVNGIAVQATARPVHVTWDMGDGTQVVCDGPGTVYEDRFGKQESPDCGHTYMKMSNPTYTVTAITAWSVEWTAQGQSGVIETLTRSSQDVRIGEFQALNVRP